MCDSELILASKSGNYQQVQLLLNSNYSVNIRDKENATPLYWSACFGHLKISDILISAGSDVNAQVVWGSTALHAASDRGHVDCVKRLIKGGSNVNIQNNRGDTALHVSSYRGNIEIVQVLIQVGADLFLKNNNGKTAHAEAEGNSHHRTAHILYTHMIASKTNLPDNLKKFITESPYRHEKQKDVRQSVPNTSFRIGRMHSLETCYSEPITSVSSPCETGDFVRYNDDMTGFCRKRDWQKTDQPSRNLCFDLDNKENLASGRNSINYNEQLSWRSVESSEHDEMIGTSHRLLNDIDQTILRHPHNSNGHVFRPSVAGSYEDLKMPPVTASPSFRPNRSSVSCVREVRSQMSPVFYDQNTENVFDTETLQMRLIKAQEDLEKSQKENEKMKKDAVKFRERFIQCENRYRCLEEENLALKKTVSGKHSSEESTAFSFGNHCIPGLLDFLNSAAERLVTCSQTDQMTLVIKDCLKRHWMKLSLPHELDIPNKEWFPGGDYFLIGDKPINRMIDEQRNGSCSLVFHIKHKNKSYVLKMMLNLLNMIISSHDEGYSMDSFLQNAFGPEYDIPVYLNPHHNVVPIRHHYMGSTDRFRKYLNLFVPTPTSVPKEMASRSTFLVMDLYPHTLKSFIAQHTVTASAESGYDLDFGYVCLMLYQLLSAVYHLHKNGIVHRNIKADNVFLDYQLRPLLADFGMAKRVQESSGRVIPFTNNAQVFAGNTHAWAPELSRWNRDGPPSGSSETMSLKEIYGKSDAYSVGRMFYSFLCPDSGNDFVVQQAAGQFCDNTKTLLECPNTIPEGLSHVLQQLVKHEPLDRMTDRKAMLTIGMLMFHPAQGEIKMESETARYCQARMLKLLAMPSPITTDATQQLLTMSESVKVLSPEVEADFLYNTSPEEFWEIYTDLKQRGFVR